MIQLKKFKQNENKKSLEQYYRRTHEIFKNFDDENKKNDDTFSRLKLIVLSQIIEKFVNELIDRQFRIKLNYKYMIEISFETQSLYDVYLIAEKYSDRMINKKKILKNLYDEKLLRILRTQNTKATLKYAMKNQSKSFIEKSKSISVDRIKRYRSQQYKKFENTMQKNTIKENEKSDRRRQANKIDDVINIDYKNEKIANKKLIQSYIDEKFSNLNVSILNKIFEKSQTISHFDNSICENMMTLSSQSQSNYDFVFYEQIIRFEKLAKTKKSIVNEIYVFDFRKRFASVTIFVFNEFSLILKKISCNLSEINTFVNITNIFAKFVVSEFVITTNLQKLLFEINIINKFSSISLKKSYQMQKNYSISSFRIFSSAHTSKS